MVHSHDPICQGCEKKLTQAHPYMREWFNKYVKPRNPDCHVAISFRGEADQNQAFFEGKSKKKWPHSKHNSTDDAGSPQAKALDLFLLSPRHLALWPIKMYQAIWADVQYEGHRIRWGGVWKTLGDANHFEWDEGPVSQPPTT